MRKFAFVLFLSCLAHFAGTAQKNQGVKVPEAVLKSFTSMFPDAKSVKWEKENNNYEAEYLVGKVEHSQIFDEKGNLIASEQEIDVNTLPQNVLNYFVKNMPGKVIKEATSITDIYGNTTYETEVDGVDYLFDVNGNFMKKESEKSDKKDND